MPIYTGVADANGDFTVPFSSNYTGGQKVTVTAEKDSATKTIELFAPSSVIGGGVIQFSGTLTNFPFNIGVITLSELTGAIANTAFDSSSGNNLFGKATGLDMSNTVVSQVGRASFQSWRAAISLILPSTLTYVDAYGFTGWIALQELIIPDSCVGAGSSSFFGMTALKKLTLGTSFINVADYAFSGMASLDEMIVKRTTPPNIHSTTFDSMKSTCVIKVPAASLAAYQAAPNWSAFASRIQAI